MIEVTEMTSVGVLSMLLCPNDLVLMSKQVTGLRNVLTKWTEDFLLM